MAAYSIGAGPVEYGDEPLDNDVLSDIRFFTRVASAIEDAVDKAERARITPKESAGLSVGGSVR